MHQVNTKNTCESCLLCIRTYVGSECQLTDNQVDNGQEACIDYINNGEDDETTI